MVKILILGLMVFTVLMVWAACIIAGEADDREEEMLRKKHGRHNKSKNGD